MILTAKEQSRLCLLESMGKNKNNGHKATSNIRNMGKFQVWLHHKRLGHPSFNIIKSLLSHLFTIVWYLSTVKASWYTCPIYSKKGNFPFDLIHYDVWRPIVESIYGEKWFITFVNDCTCVMWTYIMKSKSWGLSNFC